MNNFFFRSTYERTVGRFITARPILLYFVNYMRKFGISELTPSPEPEKSVRSAHNEIIFNYDGHLCNVLLSLCERRQRNCKGHFSRHCEININDLAPKGPMVIISIR